MMINEVSRLTGVSIRTLQYYDRIGLLKATAYTGAGYRLYDDAALEQLQQILLFRELEFPLKEIKRIMCSPDYDKNKALEQQITLLEMKKEHIEGLIGLAHRLKFVGGKYMEFSVFDRKKMVEYERKAKESWGGTEEYREFEEKNRGRTASEAEAAGRQLLEIVGAFGELKGLPVSNSAVKGQVRKLQAYITEHYYTCSDAVLEQLGVMYGAGGEFTENINAVGGPGAAEYASEAIHAYCMQER